MKTSAVVLSIVAVVAANKTKKIKPAVLESLQQSSTVDVLVAYGYLLFLENPRGSSLYSLAKCKPGLLNGEVDCYGLTEEELYSIAALPEVDDILPARDYSAFDSPKITPKPTTTAATPTHSACNEQRDSSDDRD
ncbi:hypothetical protein H257_13645 [Aphanomyces astaci]|uniref:Uncharacterized protein n=1 Tax=Aphanomyces astaci TaxID=112090 RepID=W4FW34_APHAT|nr:hypothetical protein H257_13645 [Aphanomyces astaci]ETV70868.1 hypothetical protein H257_13645 [Aphanomyces astaci]RQM19810.1 hypothetical protein B5M09_011184 [Aphanomyces astaci]|eukprot:XP_009839531.1 hypothetical protein H257_13645 [Aphanomyces astaci]